MNAIETEQLTRSFGERVAVQQLNLTIPAGTVFGFLGPNGAGKTTTVRMLTALIAPTSGVARVAGFQLGEQNSQIRKAVGLLTETPGLYEQLSAWQNLIFFGQLYDLSQKQAEKQTKHYLERLGLWERRDDRIGGFSKGMRQKIAIVRSLLHEPQIVFLDEPTAGLDPEAARTVRDFIRELRSEGRTIFLTTHNLPEADELCDLIGLFRSTLLRVDTPERLRTTLFGHGVTIRLANPATPFIAIVQKILPNHQVQAVENNLIIELEDPDQQNPLIAKALIEAGANIRYIEPREHTLEEVYFQLIHSTEGAEHA